MIELLVKIDTIEKAEPTVRARVVSILKEVEREFSRTSVEIEHVEPKPQLSGGKPKKRGKAAKPAGQANAGADAGEAGVPDSGPPW